MYLRRNGSNATVLTMKFRQKKKKISLMEEKVV